MRNIDQLGIVFCTDNLPATTTDRVKAALEKTGLDPEMARDLAKRYCFTRAKNHLRDSGLIDEVSESEEYWVWQLSRRFREENKLGYEFEASFWFDKSDQSVGADNPRLLIRVEELFARHGALYLPGDITKLVRRVFDRQRGMLPLRHAGVVYFVPRENLELMNKVAAFIAQIGGECISAEIGSGNTAVKEKALSMLVESVRKELSTLVSELKNSESGGDTLSARKARNRWSELVGQLERIKLFARSLTADASQLFSQVRTAELDLALIGEMDLDVMAALAHSGKLNGYLGTIAKTAFSGTLPALSSPRVQAAALQLGCGDQLTEISALPALAQHNIPALSIQQL